MWMRCTWISPATSRDAQGSSSRLYLDSLLLRVELGDFEAAHLAFGEWFRLRGFGRSGPFPAGLKHGREAGEVGFGRRRRRRGRGFHGICSVRDAAGGANAFA